MSKIPFITLLATCVFLSGCASPPLYRGPHTSNPAILKGKTANLVKFTVGAEAHVSILEVDGFHVMQDVWTGGGNGAKVDPGRRRITVHIRGERFREAQGDIELEVKAGRTYRFTGRQTGADLELSVWDETAGPDHRVLLTRQTLPGAPSRQRLVLPLYVPRS